MHTHNGPAKAIQTNKLHSCMYSKPTLEVHLTFLQTRKCSMNSRFHILFELIHYLTNDCPKVYKNEIPSSFLSF